MTGHPALTRGERGLVLPVALIVLLLLGALAIALVTLAGLEPAIARNLADAMRARMLAEAGLERARLLLVAAVPWTDLLADGDAGDALLLDATALPGLGAHEGTHTVRVRNDWQVGDSALTGLLPDVGGRATDTNEHLVVASTGRAGRARRTVLAVARRLSLPVPPGVLGITGPGPAVALGGDRVEIDGRDHDGDGGPGSCPPAWSVAVSDPEAEAAVEATVPAAVGPRLRGRAQDDTLAPEGANTVAADARLDAAAIAQFVDAVRRQADVVLDGRAGPVVLSSIGRACAAEPPGEDCWGTAERPRVVLVTGPAPHGVPLLELSGQSAGQGVLVVDGGAARVTGDFHWRGLIVVTGPGAALELAGGGEQTVVGGVVIARPPDDATPGAGLLATDARLLRSCAALARASRAPRLVTLQGWHEVPLY